MFYKWNHLFYGFPLMSKSKCIFTIQLITVKSVQYMLYKQFKQLAFHFQECIRVFASRNTWNNKDPTWFKTRYILREKGMLARGYILISNVCTGILSHELTVWRSTKLEECVCLWRCIISPVSHTRDQLRTSWCCHPHSLPTHSHTQTSFQYFTLWFCALWPTPSKVSPSLYGLTFIHSNSILLSF